MPADHLVGHHLCPTVQRAAITLTEKSVPFERTYVDLAGCLRSAGQRFSAFLQGRGSALSALMHGTEPSLV